MTRVGPRINIVETGDRGWTSEAACRDSDPDLFYPATESGPDLEKIRVAKAICAICTVQPDCLLYALRNHEEHGIWGGLTESERRDYSSASRAKRRQQM